MSARRGRPPSGSLLTVDDVFAAAADRLALELPVTQAELAADLSTNRRTLADVVRRDTGLSFGDWISRISRPSGPTDAEDAAMKRITVTLADSEFTALRRAAMAELRDPRLHARLLLERALATSQEPRRIVRPEAVAS